MAYKESWLLMWSLTYIICAILKPNIFQSLPPLWSCIVMIVFGGYMLVGLFFRQTTAGRIILFISGVLETISGVASWTGIIYYNVPFADKALFNIMMSGLDGVSAIILFSLTNIFRER